MAIAFEHQYLKDDDALDQYLTQSALEGCSIFVNPEAPPINGSALEALVRQFRSVGDTIRRLGRLYAPDVLWQMVYGARLSQDQMSDETAVQAFCLQLGERLRAAGFSRVLVWFRCLNWASFIAWP